LAIVYSCSGCSSAAQLSNHLAVRLDRDGHAEMSCIAGVGGNVPSLVRKAVNAAQTGRPIISIDGCVLACVRGSLAQRGIEPTMHLQLGEHGVPKEYHADFSEAQADSLYEQLRRRIEVMTVWMR
jgi:uncharacterized metal-binding protein